MSRDNDGEADRPSIATASNPYRAPKRSGRRFERNSSAISDYVAGVFLGGFLGGSVGAILSGAMRLREQGTILWMVIAALPLYFLYGRLPRAAFFGLIAGWILATFIWTACAALM